MRKNQKKLIVSLLSAIGLIVLLVPIFTQVYTFGVGLIIAISIWIISGIIAQYWEIKEK